MATKNVTWVHFLLWVLTGIATMVLVFLITSVILSDLESEPLPTLSKDGYTLVNGEPTLFETELGFPKGSLHTANTACLTFGDGDTDTKFYSCLGHALAWIEFSHVYGHEYKKFCSEDKKVMCILSVTQYMAYGGVTKE